MAKEWRRRRLWLRRNERQRADERRRTPPSRLPPLFHLRGGFQAATTQWGGKTMVFRSRLLMFFFLLLLRHQHTHTRRQGVEEGREENFSSSALRTYTCRQTCGAKGVWPTTATIPPTCPAGPARRRPSCPLPTSSLRAEGRGGG